MISVLVCARNEEANIARCLEALRWSDDVVVLDDGSQDGTVAIAKAHGARVLTHSAGGELAQRTFSIRSIQFKYPWVFNPDADEVCTAELRDEMLAKVADPTRREVAYRVRFKTMFKGRWLRYSSLYPTWVVRLFRPERLSFARTTNLTYLVDGDEGRLSSHFLHFTFERGIAAWVDKHNVYSSSEALEGLALLERPSSIRTLVAELLSSNSVVRRRATKELSVRLPLRPLLRFVYMYVLRRGFLDGSAGLSYCALLAFYELLIVLKMAEHQTAQTAASRFTRQTLNVGIERPPAV